MKFKALLEKLNKVENAKVELDDFGEHEATFVVTIDKHNRPDILFGRYWSKKAHLWKGNILKKIRKNIEKEGGEIKGWDWVDIDVAIVYFFLD